ncbi:hypothetical protein POVCU2_0022580 [Plasmodium ovale curtisi]|uniref:Uncharacterized protein n=1 Tax=Plasmodium ovale curtisi TaxID=864141 RepID=A0A1A8XF65_PLAOA|nr:hypothetical protein POVCU2_0022580 [Plasmodium ovale curtisi]SBT02524.1 hypothetical protein POVCU1_077910 [Plasmodium ovale curtisi]
MQIQPHGVDYMCKNGKPRNNMVKLLHLQKLHLERVFIISMYIGPLRRREGVGSKNLIHFKTDEGMAYRAPIYIIALFPNQDGADNFPKGQQMSTPIARPFCHFELRVSKQALDHIAPPNFRVLSKIKKRKT